MQQVAKLAGRLAPAAVGVAAAASSSSTSTAHAHVRPSAVATVDAPLSAKTIKEEWELADISSDRVIFKPADIEEAASYLTRAIGGGDDDELWTSDGEAADSIIELDCHASQQAAPRQEWGSAVAMASRLLKSPAVQQEIVAAALEDPEVFAILAQRQDVVKYLCDSGFAAAGLLTAPPEGADAASEFAAAAGKGEEAEPGSLPNWVHAVARPVEALGDSLVQLGSWIRTKFSGEAAANKEEGAQGKGERAPGGTPWVLTAVMTAMVAIVAIIILRRR